MPWPVIDAASRCLLQPDAVPRETPSRSGHAPRPNRHLPDPALSSRRWDRVVSTPTSKGVRAPPPAGSASLVIHPKPGGRQTLFSPFPIATLGPLTVSALPPD